MAKDPPEVPKYYWDANVFLAGISSEPGRAPVVLAVLEEAAKGLCEIFTSVLSIAEVAYGAVEKQGGQLDPAVEARIEALWHPSSPIKMLDFDPLIARDARGLIRRAISGGKSGLKPADAIHLASAIRIGASEVHTYDRLDRYQPYVAVPVREPHTYATPLFPEGLPAKALPSGGPSTG